MACGQTRRSRLSWKFMCPISFSLNHIPVHSPLDPFSSRHCNHKNHLFLRSLVPCRGDQVFLCIQCVSPGSIAIRAQRTAGFRSRPPLAAVPVASPLAPLTPVQIPFVEIRALCVTSPFVALVRFVPFCSTRTVRPSRFSLRSLSSLRLRFRVHGSAPLPHGQVHG